MLDGILAQADAAVSEIAATIAAHTTARANAQASADQAGRALAGAEQALAAATAAHDQAAAQLPPLAQQLASAQQALSAAQTAHAQAAQAVVDHDGNMPEPPEPNSRGVIPPGAMARYKAALKAWQERRAQLVATEQATASNVAAAQGQVNAAAGAYNAQQGQINLQQAAVNAATATRDSAAASLNAAEAAILSEDQALAALAPEQGRRTQRRDHLRALVTTIEADPINRPELEASADELSRWLWDLRRQRAAHEDARRQLEHELQGRRDQHAAAWSQFDALRAEFDAEFGYKRNDVPPEWVANGLGEAIAAAQQRVAAAAQRLDQTAAKVAEHGAP
jgi:chromosome segregation ATPase